MFLDDLKELLPLSGPLLKFQRVVGAASAGGSLVLQMENLGWSRDQERLEGTRGGGGLTWKGECNHHHRRKQVAACCK